MNLDNIKFHILEDASTETVSVQAVYIALGHVHLSRQAWNMIKGPSMDDVRATAVQNLKENIMDELGISAGIRGRSRDYCTRCAHRLDRCECPPIIDDMEGS